MSVTGSLSTLPGPKPARYWGDGDLNALRSGIVNVVGPVVEAVSSLSTGAPSGLTRLTGYATGNTTQGSTGTAPLSSFIMSGAGIASVGYSSGTVIVSVPAGGGVGDGGNVIAAGTSTAASTGTIVWANSNGVSFGLSGSTVTATVKTDYLTTAQPPGAYLTTAMASDAGSRFAGTAGAITGGSITVNTSGVSVNLPAYLTTAQPPGAYLTTAAQSDHSHGNPTLALTNLTGTTASASNGFTLSLSAAAPGGGAAQTFSAGTTSSAPNPIHFVNSNGVSFGLNGSQLTASVATAYRASNDAVGLNTAATQVTWTVNSSGISLNAGAYLTTAQPVGAYLTTARASNDAIGLNTAASNVTWTANSSGLSLDARGYAGTGTSATNASLTLNSNGLAVSVAAPGGGAPVPGYWALPPWGNGSESNALLTNITGISRRFLFFPFEVNKSLSFGELHWPMSRAATGVNRFSVFLGIYTHVNFSSIRTIWNTSVSYSNSATASGSGLRGFEATWASSSLSPGHYVLGMMFDPVGGSTSAMNYSIMGAATGNSMLQTQIVNGADTYHTNVNHMWLPFHGRYSVTSANVPADVVSGDILAQGNATAVPLPMYWILGTHYGA